MNGVALGVNTISKNSNGSFVGGEFAKVENSRGAIVVGSQAKAENAIGGIALGHFASVSVSNGVALGSSSVSNVDKLQIGYGLEANSEIKNKIDTFKKAEQQLLVTLNAAEEEYKTKDKAYEQASDEHRATAKAERDVAKANYETKQTELKEKRKEISTWLSTAAAVSLGNEDEGITRQLNNLAAGTKDTDAVNVAQLKAIEAKVASGGVDAARQFNEVNTKLTEHTSQLDSQKEQLQSQNNRLNTVETDVNRHQQAINQVNTELTKHSTRLNTVESDVNRHQVEINQVNTKLIEHQTQFEKVDNQFRQLDKRLNKMTVEYRSGIAGSNAMAGVPTVQAAGESIFGLGVGSFKGESAVAAGYSTALKKGKVVVKFNASINSRGDIGTSGGVGWKW